MGNEVPASFSKPTFLGNKKIRLNFISPLLYIDVFSMYFLLLSCTKTKSLLLKQNSSLLVRIEGIHHSIYCVKLVSVNMYVLKRWVFSYFVWPPITAFPFSCLNFPDVGNKGILGFFYLNYSEAMNLVAHVYLVLSVTELVFTRILRRVFQAKE